MPRNRKSQPKSGDREVNAKVRMIDDISEFEAFRREILPGLRKDLSSGMSSDDILAKYKSYMAARQVTIALTSEDEGKAQAAIKDSLDRVDGKAKERKEVEHKFAKLSDEELDALVSTRLSDQNEAK